MEYNNDKDYKYSIQDTSHLYLGARMSFEEILDWEDVPFKMKTIVHKYFYNADRPGEGFKDALLRLDTKDFTYQICKQLRMKIKAGCYCVKVNRKGQEEKKYVSKTYSLDEYLAIIHETEGIISEEISVSKLALLAFSV